MNQCNKFGRKLRILSLCFILLAAVTVFAVTPFAFAEDQTVSDEAAAKEGSAGILEEEPFIPPVSFTNVAPFGEPVQGTAPAYAVQAADENGTETDDGMQLKKTATANDDGTYTIQMEAYATGEKVISEVSKDVPTDIVLVLDQSGSMANNFSKEYSWTSRGTHTNSQNYNSKNNLWYQLSDGSYVKVTVNRNGSYNNYTYTYTDANGQNVTLETSTGASTNCQTVFYQRSNAAKDVTRLEALKNAVTSFSNSVAAKAAGKDGKVGTDDDINHRIAVVGFASGRHYGNVSYDYGNTELFVGGTQYTYNAGSNNNPSNRNSAQSHYNEAFQNMSTSVGVSSIADSVNALGADGGTLTNLGLEMANGIFWANPISEGESRNRVVIMFTDGEPGWSGFDGDTANNAIAQAGTAKNTYGATVYTVGIFSGADATSAGNEHGNDNTAKANWFMQQVSSNNGSPKSPSYYLSAANADDLNSIFQQISDKVETGGTSSTLTSDSVVKDVISPYFTLPNGTTANDITLETYACTGKNGSDYTWNKNTDAMGATASIIGDQVNVTGFDFSKNYVGTVTEGNNVTYRGHKLVISFNVKAKPGFLGGNNVPTNAGAGIYAKADDADAVKTFEVPTVNVPIPDINVSATDKNVYLLGSIGTDELSNGATITAGEDVTLDLSKANDDNNPYGLERWRTAYVDIVTSVTNEKDEVLTGDLQGLTDDVTFHVNATVKPKSASTGDATSGDAATEKTNKGSAKINVFKPEVAFKDSQIYLGQTANYSDNQVDNGVVWKHGDTVVGTAGVTMIGEAPALAYEYSPVAGAFKKDTNVKVTVKIGENDVTSHVSFKRIDLENNTTTVANTDNLRTNFIVHVKGFELRIEKTGAQPIDENQSFIFNVERLEGDTWSLVTQAVVLGNRYVTITELPIGTYRVTEDANWSWRYKLQNVTGGVVGDMQPFANQVIFTGEDNEFSKTLIFTNERTKTKWLNGSAFCQNYWTKDEGGNWKVEQRIFPNQENNQNN